MATWIVCFVLLAAAVLHITQSKSVPQVAGCRGLVESGVNWDAVRVDLTHIVQQVLQGALSRDLLAAKDSGGRDPAVSYGDVQLQRHLERIQRLVTRLPDKQHSACLLGQYCLRIFVSAVYSGLQWDRWFDQYRMDLIGAVHGSNWTEAISSGWPLLEIVTLVAELHGATQHPSECGDADLSFVVGLVDDKKEIDVDQVRGAADCAFAQAVASLASAVSAAVTTASAFPGQAHRENMNLLSAAQSAVERAVGAGLGIPQTPLFAHPIPSLLSRLTQKLQEARRQQSATSHVDIVYCGHLDLDDSELESVCNKHQTCELHRFTAASFDESNTVCYTFLRKVVKNIRARGNAGKQASASTLILSPFTWQWNTDTSPVDLSRLLREQSHWRKEVSWAGLPCLNSSRILNWPVHRLRHQYWKLAYAQYATGHETSQYVPLAQHWAVGDTTSCTRVYSTPTLLKLVDHISELEKDNPLALPLPQEPLGPPSGVAEFFVALDVAAKARGLKAYTLLTGAALENDYRARVALSSRFARTFHVEAARFLPGAAQQTQCLFPHSKDAAAFTAQHGVVVSWCTRNSLRTMFQDVGRWWLGLDPRRHIIVPVSASVLNLFRSGDLDLFPWDADIDANFIAAHPVVVGSIMEDHAEQLEKMGYTYILRGDRVVIRDLRDTARMDIWISGPQDVVAYDIRARLCGVRVNFFRDQLEGTVYYYRPAEKIFGNTRGMLLHCRWAGHNACLPDCLRDGLGVGSDGCEFPDRFVHLDV